jgi:ABC-type branched-subunit amino acid transport system substrate-binding protein
MGEMQNEWTIEDGHVTRRTVLLGALGAIGATSFLAACGSDDDTGSDSTTAMTSGDTTASDTAAPAADDVGSTLATLLGIDTAAAGKGESVDLGAVLALTGSGSYYGKTMSRGLDLAKKHIEAAGGPTFNYIYLDHKSGDPQAGVTAMTELVSKHVPAKFASYVDDLGAMLPATAENKMFTLDGGGGTNIFGQGQPYFWGTRAVTPNDPLPGLLKYTKEVYPDAKTVGQIVWDLGEPANGIIKDDILNKISDAGYEFNGLYELVPVGGQDFSQVLPKIKANEPDILLVGNYGQDPGSFANQAATAGLETIRFGFDFTPDAVQASKGTFDSEGFTFTYDYFDAKNPVSPLAKLFVSEFVAEYGEDPDFYAANFYENALVMWEVMRRVIAKGGDIRDGDALDQGLRENLTVVSVYGGDESTVGTYTLDETTHSVIERGMGVFEYKAGAVTPKAFFGIGGVDFTMA